MSPDETRCIDENTLLGYGQGLLPERLAAEVEAHLDRCGTCQRWVSALLHTSAFDSSPGDSEQPLATPGPRSVGAPLAVGPLPTLQRGEKLGRYVIIEVLGSGGMGVVYRAYDPDLDRRVALKRIRLSGGSAETLRAFLMREAQAMARLSHPNVVAVYDVGSAGDEVFIAMELVEGQTLAQWQREKVRSWREIVPLFLQAGAGLAAAHAAGLVHRDFKPDNVLIGSDGRVRVTDFGLARLSSTPVEPVARGAVVGTRAYMAPECLAGAPADERSDQFSFCVALHEALYGDRSSAAALPAVGRAGTPRLQRGSGCLRDAVMRGLQQKPEDRHPGMEALLAELSRDRRRPMRLGLAVGALVLVAAAVAAVVVPERAALKRCRDAKARLAGVWDEPRKAEIARAFAATKQPYAADALSGSTAALERYANGWAAARQEACDATYVRREQSPEMLGLRAACLDERLDELRVLADLLATADPVLVRRAAALPEQLTPLRACAHPRTLAAAGAGTLPAEQAARLNRAKREVMRGRVLLAAGRLPSAKELAISVADEAKQLGVPALQAEAGLLLGSLQTESGEPELAQQTLSAAISAAEASHSDAVTARAWIMLMLTAYDRRQFDRAREWGVFAEGAVKRLGGDLELEARLEGVTTQILWREGRVDEALARAERLVGLAQQVPDRPRAVVPVLGMLGILRSEKGDLKGGAAALERQAQLAETAYGPYHPGFADCLTNLAIARWKQGELAEALRLFERVLTIQEAGVGPEHPMVAPILQNLAELRGTLGKPEQAKADAERALRLQRRAYGERSAQVAVATQMLGSALASNGQHAEALTLYRTALATLEAVAPGSVFELEGVHTRLGDVLLELGQAQAAAREFEASVALLRKAGVESGLTLTYVLTGLGRAQLKLEQRQAAVESLERALAVREKTDCDPVELATTRFWLGRALGSGERADSLSREAEEALRAAGERGARVRRSFR